MGPIQDTKAERIARRAVKAAAWIGRGENEAEACRKAGIPAKTFRNYFARAWQSEYGVEFRLRLNAMDDRPRYSPTITN